MMSEMGINVREQLVLMSEEGILLTEKRRKGVLTRSKTKTGK